MYTPSWKSDEQLNAETKAAGLVKGESACNRTSCQTRLDVTHGTRWWNTETRAFYCSYCARRINESSKVSLGREICITESEKWQLDMKPHLDNAVKNLTKPQTK